MARGPIIINPKATGKAAIAVCLPSYNEAKNIGFVTRQVDRGLTRYFPKTPAVIVNADSASADQTARVFLRTPTKTAKISIVLPATKKGKGHNLRVFFRQARALNARFAMTADADLKSIKPDWIVRLMRPLLATYDFVSPVYRRHKYDGLITRHLCYPLLYGVLGLDIAQPIGGEFGFSRTAVKRFGERIWPKSAFGYGVDIFLTMEAFFGGLKMAQVELGAKHHNPSQPKLWGMFQAVADALFGELVAHRAFWGRGKIARPRLYRQKPAVTAPRLAFDFPHALQTFRRHFRVHRPFYERALPEKAASLLKREAASGNPGIDDVFWAELVYRFLRLYGRREFSRSDIVKGLAALAFGRFYSYARAAQGLSDYEADRLVAKQARLFRARRS